MSPRANAAGLAINWHIFGSNGQEKADYSRGVLERFTRRGQGNPSADFLIKTIANPRKILLKPDAHWQYYFVGFHSINENGGVVPQWNSNPVSDKKIIINHYHTKSREEYLQKLSRGAADGFNNYERDRFKDYDHNEEFDDGILKYRDARAKVYQPPDNLRAEKRVFNSLIKNLSPTILPDSQEFCKGKMETFLTCRAASSYFKKKFPNNSAGSFLEELSVVNVFKSLDEMSVSDAQLLIRELPNLLQLPYPVVGELRRELTQRIPNIMDKYLHSASSYTLWNEFVNMDYIHDLLKVV